MRWLLAAVGLAGCNALFGIDDLGPSVVQQASVSSSQSAQATSGPGGAGGAGASTVSTGVGGAAGSGGGGGGGGATLCRLCSSCLGAEPPCDLEELCGYQASSMSCAAMSSCELLTN